MGGLMLATGLLTSGILSLVYFILPRTAMGQDWPIQWTVDFEDGAAQFAPRYTQSLGLDEVGKFALRGARTVGFRGWVAIYPARNSPNLVAPLFPSGASDTPRKA
jgi:hypothetical protein